MDLNALNDYFTPLSPISRLRELYTYFDEEEVLFTSSFGTSSAYLLHLVSRFRPSQPVYFINTRFHFEETLQYKLSLGEQLGLNVLDVKPQEEDHEEALSKELWKKNPNLCCVLNKVLPLEAIKAEHRVWISGVMSHQTKHRKNLKVFEKQGAIIKFHPLIDYTEQDFKQYLEFFDLPPHPLQAQGYDSIGCTHCTAKGKGRSGRWQGQAKTECGLHPGYFEKQVISKMN